MKKLLMLLLLCLVVGCGAKDKTPTETNVKPEMAPSTKKLMKLSRDRRKLLDKGALEMGDISQETYELRQLRYAMEESNE